MRNLVQNQHGTFTFRKLVSNRQVRVSLRTSDKLEAIRIADRATALITAAKSNDPYIIKTIVNSVVVEMSPTLQQERLDSIQSLLSTGLKLDRRMLLSDLIQRYTAEKLRSGAWASKTQLIYRVIYENLLELLGDKGIREISPSDAQYVKSSFQKLPSNVNKKARYKGKPLKKILKMNVPESDLMSVKTINIKLGCFSELFKWAMKNSYLDNNVFDGVLLKDVRRARELRLPFTPEDLLTLFNSHWISRPRQPWHFWIPALALYTGARLNEICQLQRKDIVQLDGIWCQKIEAILNLLITTLGMVIRLLYRDWILIDLNDEDDVRLRLANTPRVGSIHIDCHEVTTPREMVLLLGHFAWMFLLAYVANLVAS